MHPDNFNQIVHEWYDPLYRFALSLCRNPDEALDLTQSAFHKLAGNAKSIKDGTKVKSWLFTVTYREFLDQYRKSQRFPSTSLDLVAEPRQKNQKTPGSSVDAAEMMTVLSAMDEKFRAPLSLFYIESFSYKEIAEVLEIPIGTVMSRLRRGKDRLRQQLEAGAANQASEPIPFRKEANNG
ncbi:MAG: RNA polymerase sigma factor [Opitutales bacterium]|nr:RNA polymerase sigma factor [Opitutales bacterium]